MHHCASKRKVDAVANILLSTVGCHLESITASFLCFFCRSLTYRVLCADGHLSTLVLFLFKKALLVQFFKTVQRYLQLLLVAHMQELLADLLEHLKVTSFILQLVDTLPFLNLLFYLGTFLGSLSIKLRFLLQILDISLILGFVKSTFIHINRTVRTVE